MGIWISEEVENVPDHVKTLCEEIFVKNGYDNCEVIVSPGCGKGENYFSNVLRLTATNRGERFSLIIKMALGQEYFRIISFAPLVFHNETTMYNELFPKFDELQNLTGLSEDERFQCAKFHGFANIPREVIILEDLNLKGYSKLEKNVDYNNVEILVTLKEIAKMHALSFVLKNKDKEFYEEFKQKLVNFWSVEYNISAVMTLYTTIQKGTSVYFEKESQKQYLKESIFELPKTAKAVYDNFMESKYSVIGIGYTWRYKPMYQFKDGQPSKAIILDFQHSTISCPAVDVHFYICNSATYNSRKLHYRNWLDYYYEQFQQFLANFKLKAEDVYPRRQYETDLIEQAKHVFGVSVLISSYWAREAEIRVQSQNVTENPAQQYKDTVVGLMNTMIELGYVD